MGKINLLVTTEQEVEEKPQYLRWIDRQEAKFRPGVPVTVTAVPDTVSVRVETPRTLRNRLVVGARADLQSQASGVIGGGFGILTLTLSLCPSLSLSLFPLFIFLSVSLSLSLSLSPLYLSDCFSLSLSLFPLFFFLTVSLSLSFPSLSF